MLRFFVGATALLGSSLACTPPEAAPHASATFGAAPAGSSATVATPAVAAPSGNAVNAAGPQAPIATCTLAALPIDPERGYCFAYYDGTPEMLAEICKQFRGRFTAGGACASEGHVGTCAMPDGSERWSYAPATSEVASKQCEALPGARFYGLGQPVVHGTASSFACDDPPRGVCRETRVSSPAALAEARRQCVGLGAAREGACPEKSRVAICQSPVPFLRDHYYAPKFDAASARKDCAGTIAP